MNWYSSCVGRGSRHMVIWLNFTLDAIVCVEATCQLSICSAQTMDGHFE